MTDVTAPPMAPSDRVGSLLGRLHPMTRFLLLAVILYTAASMVGVIFPANYRFNDAPMFSRVSSGIATLAYCLTLLAGPATVEFLFRIWDELKRLRTLS